jgi:TonB family protein
MGNRAVTTAFTTLVLLQTVVAGAQSSPGPPARRPLVVAVSVDYFRALPSRPQNFSNSPGIRLADRIEERWSIPAEIAFEKGVVIAEADLDQSGVLSNVSISQPSLVSGLNRAASTALAEVSPMALRPGEAPESPLRLTIVFFYNIASTPGSMPPPAGWPPSRAVPLGTGVSTPVLEREVKPLYTRLAMRAGIQGAVLMTAVVEADGTVRDAIISRSLDQTFGLDDQALATAREWRFSPGTREGNPVPVLVTIELTFTLK